MNDNESLVSYFLKLKCAGDVLNIVNPINKLEKELTESLSVIKHIRKIALKSPMEYTLIDLCAGNALTSVISTYLLPIKRAVAVDKKKHIRKWENVKRFEYIEADIDNFNLYSSEKIIVTATHACKNLATKIIDLYKNTSNAKHLILMPCCIGEINTVPQIVKDKLGKYFAWSLHLSNLSNGTFYEEKKCISPCNNVIVAHK